jgi:hypothetical protein
MKAYKSLVKFALANNAKVSVHDGEEWAVKKSTKYSDIIDAIESVESAELRIRDANDEPIGWALIIPDLADDETVADFTETEFMMMWDERYSKSLA